MDALQFRNHVYGVHRDSGDSGWEEELERAQSALIDGENRFFVYVIELEPEVYSGTPVYVGMTKYPPIKRFKKHKKGEHSSSHVEKRGVRLRPKLNPTNELPMPMEEAEKQEVAVRKELEEEAFQVFGASQEGYKLDL